ncbi:MAG: hypothetical protein KDE59_21615 [Anaerolineales bacterium]|nr:hypothetical protein [Anaerolineales bacterium]
MTFNDNFLNCITLAQMYPATSNSAKLYIFQTAVHQIINSEKLFWKAVINTFPLQPRLIGPGPDLAILADALVSGLGLAGDSQVDILWPFADGVPPALLQEKIQFFRDVTDTVRSGRIGQASWPGAGFNLRIFLVCANEFNQKELLADLGMTEVAAS